MDSNNITSNVIHTKNTNNNEIVQTLYRALSNGDTSTVSGLICSDLEWWFHGPPNCHHMMNMLTGKASLKSFKFVPRSVDAVDDGYVIVEGWEGLQAYWVHVWTLKDGLITQFREYFNTWLTVADLKPLGCSRYMLWQSHPRDLAQRSLPSLMLAI